MSWAPLSLYSFYDTKLYKSVNWHFASPLHVGSYHSLTTMSWISIYLPPLSSLSHNIFGWPSFVCTNQWLFKAALHSQSPLWWSPSALICTTLICTFLQKKSFALLFLYDTLSSAEEDPFLSNTSEAFLHVHDMIEKLNSLSLWPFFFFFPFTL